MHKKMYFWVLLSIFAGAVLGRWFPQVAISLRPISEGFIGLIKMVVGPLIFCTVSLGIANTKNSGSVGRVAGKAILYFELMSTFALLIGLLVGNLIHPGAGLHIERADLKMDGLPESVQKTGAASFDMVSELIPKSFFDAFSGGGHLLQILLLALLFGFALRTLKVHADPFRLVFESFAQTLFRIVDFIMWLSPLAAGSAMGFTVAKFGLESLSSLGLLLGCFYLTCGLFIFVVLGFVARLTGFRILALIKYLREEILLVFATSSSESALAPLMEKLENWGCSKSIVGLIVPTGYSFNLDGTNIYITLAVLFLAQALGIELSLSQQFSILLTAMITSKGAAGVTGSGFVTLAATLAIVPEIPVASIAIILGIDRFMSEARAITNLLGNAVATIVISKSEGELHPPMATAAVSR